MEKLIETAKNTPEKLNEGERALANAATDAQAENLPAPVFGLGMDVVWDRQIAEIVAVAKTWNIPTILYASRQCDSVATLGLFSEAGARIGALQKLALGTSFEPERWAFEINIF